MIVLRSGEQPWPVMVEVAVDEFGQGGVERLLKAPMVLGLALMESNQIAASPITRSRSSTSCSPGVSLRLERNRQTLNRTRAPRPDGLPSEADTIGPLSTPQCRYAQISIKVAEAGRLLLCDPYEWLC